jgi:hypothetical protein
VRTADKSRKGVRKKKAPTIASPKSEYRPKAAINGTRIDRIVLKQHFAVLEPSCSTRHSQNITINREIQHNNPKSMDSLTTV